MAKKDIKRRKYSRAGLQRDVAFLFKEAMTDGDQKHLDTPIEDFERECEDARDRLKAYVDSRWGLLEACSMAARVLATIDPGRLADRDVQQVIAAHDRATAAIREAIGGD